ncbi:Lsr2 family DNA-binding protein, partial [Streptomyces anthocyanicus]|uniref:Lsr2 family DNA-binding protein n=1 Tax=Streptomyces anthocyanicus TaxID=68174 RepID=UPI00364F7D28
ATALTLGGLLEPNTPWGRRPGGRTTAGRGKGRVAASGSQDTAKIRAWAKENGMEVNDRGRVPAHVKAAYEDANR